MLSLVYIVHPSRSFLRQMIQAAQKLSSSLRSAATQCDNFIKTLTGQPNAAANAFANNVGTDFLTLASGNLGAQSLAAAAAAAGASGQQGMPTNTMGTPGRKSISKEERRMLKKQRKANRDPNAPKRPPSAYLLFQNEIREDMRQQFKELSYSDVLGKISEAWKNLTDEQRKVYNDRTMDHMARWNQSRRLQQQQQNQFSDENYQDTVDPSIAGQDFSNGLLNVGNPATLNTASQSRKGGEKKRSRKA
ncbi:uncharacterized protein FA14DRAFT_9579 [Meira miltonrushii]|uniref:HMG box domain-containing protein n=1 Tax=Meira miltonrushii TaxID=1280837 RepID=A0A316VJ30_9BASI|nr:uncharacterized protein FA14DRAFT_9579 [Meira miltonrushii]PWN37068.1 hypothetical protein FA14DRAFT_9579 [Meira miltonrushii]